MTAEDALNLSVEVPRLRSNKGELCLNATFGRSRLKAHWVDALGVKISPYYIDYGFLAGNFSFRLSGCRARAKDRLSPGNVPVLVSEKITKSTETAGAVTRTSKAGAGISIKDGPTVSAEDGDQTTSSEKSGVVAEITHVRALLHLSGPDDKPAWRIESVLKDTCLSGRAPGSGNPPLAILHFDQYPASIEATFSILPKDVDVTEINPGSFSKEWIPKAAVARRALRKRLASLATHGDGSVVVRTYTLSPIIP
ncbi:hypothetical protein [Sphingomonas sp. OTU376]|uniref:hypothetical protein n=1 Tax=Sphingomonas sp. OTU376 TaxID=3043863 RepID=UPI00313DA4C0